MAFEVLSVTTGVVTATTNNTYILGVAPTTMSQGSWTPSKVSITSPSLVTGVTAAQDTFTFKRYRGAVDQGTWASYVTSTGNDLPALTEVSLPITAATTFLPGDVITCALAQTGAGTALPAGVTIKVELQ